MNTGLCTLTVHSCHASCRAQEYQLSGRGLRVISGRNEDDAGAESNGAARCYSLSKVLTLFAVWCSTLWVSCCRD